jgi:predicted anti-sigma-YlaC factor YlaD
VDAELLEFDCPRCAAPVSEAHYGPCNECRAALRSQYAGLARDDVMAEEYAPKMNVTPNAVALKDD